MESLSTGLAAVAVACFRELMPVNPVCAFFVVLRSSTLFLYLETQFSQVDLGSSSTQQLQPTHAKVHSAPQVNKDASCANLISPLEVHLNTPLTRIYVHMHIYHIKAGPDNRKR